MSVMKWAGKSPAVVEVEVNKGTEMIPVKQLLALSEALALDSERVNLSPVP